VSSIEFSYFMWLVSLNIRTPHPQADAQTQTEKRRSSREYSLKIKLVSV
jgi:hypothetical protein